MTKRNILLVEDDKNLGYVVKDFLELSGYEVQLEENGEKGWEAFAAGNFHMCILDIMLPLKDGFTLAEDIRRTDPHVPIIFFTSKNLTEDKIKGLRLGGDDYITKPFSIDELLARIEALFRRVDGWSSRPQQTQFQIGRYTFDFTNSSLVLDGVETSLSRKENELLRMLCEHKDQVLKREKALKQIWGENDYFLGRSMDVYIAKLRKKLKKDPSISITNLHGIGFKLKSTR